MALSILDTRPLCLDESMRDFPAYVLLFNITIVTAAEIIPICYPSPPGDGDIIAQVLQYSVVRQRKPLEYHSAFSRFDSTSKANPSIQAMGATIQKEDCQENRDLVSS